MVVDVRSFPRSRTNPQFNTEVLPETLAPLQMRYEHWPDLGGRRPKQPDVDDGINDFWNNRSFHNYADYALGPDFQNALEQLIATTAERRPALMCSEAVWWRCHRRIITDHLLARGFDVFHIMDRNKLVEASLTRGAVITKDRQVTYPAQQ
jgi:uncharacterized protein (DUF488 family)